MTIAGELINILGFKIEGEDKLRRYNKQLDSTEDDAERSASNIRQIGVAASAATAGAIALGAAGYKNFAEFERTMNRIGITANATADATIAAGGRVQQLAQDFSLPLDQAVNGLDVLVSSGLDLEQAMAFLPSVLATAQASGAATADIANTAIKAASALKIEAGDMQRAFDIMVEGGKAGQFELKDMSQYIPELANTFANLGYSGEEGLKRLVAVLQTVREDTGSAGTAATQVGEIFGKMMAPEVVKNFKDLGVNIKQEMETAKAAGEDLLTAYVRISQETMKNNPKATLVDLFSDKEMRLGMQSLMSSTDAFDKFMTTLNSGTVDGAVFRDLTRILGDSKSQVDSFSNSWDTLMKQIGASVAPAANNVLQNIAGSMAEANAVGAQLEKEGLSFVERRLWELTHNNEEYQRKAREGGFIAPTDEARRAARETPDAYKLLGRSPNRPVSLTPEITRAERDAAAAADSATRDRYNADNALNMDAYDARLRGETVVTVAPAASTPATQPTADATEAVTLDPGTIREADAALVAFVAAATKAANDMGAADLAGDPDAQAARTGNRQGGLADLGYGFDAYADNVETADPMARTMPADAYAAKMQALAAEVAGINANLAQMTGAAPVNATVTDARQDNRQFPVSAPISITQHIQQATQAPGAAASATGQAVSNAVTGQAARIQQEPAF